MWAARRLAAEKAADWLRADLSLRDVCQVRVDMPRLMRAVGVPLLSAKVAWPMGPESRVVDEYFAIVGGAVGCAPRGSGAGLCLRPPGQGRGLYGGQPGGASPQGLHAKIGKKWQVGVASGRNGSGKRLGA